MYVTARRLREALDRVPDDAQVWIEYPARYGLATPNEMWTTGVGTPDEADMIFAASVGHSHDRKRLYIFHHI